MGNTIIYWRTFEEAGCEYHKRDDWKIDIYEIPLYWGKPNYYRTCDTLEEVMQIWENLT